VRSTEDPVESRLDLSSSSSSSLSGEEGEEEEGEERGPLMQIASCTITLLCALKCCLRKEMASTFASSTCVHIYAYTNIYIQIYLYVLTNIRER